MELTESEVKEFEIDIRNTLHENYVLKAKGETDEDCQVHDIMASIHRFVEYNCERANGTKKFPIDIKHPEVIAFAEAMDEVLCKNDHKGGWHECSLEYLDARLVEEMGEYFKLIAQNQSYQVTDINVYLKQKRKELVDISNFCMMLWDRR